MKAVGLALLLLLTAPAVRAGDSISGLWEEVSTPGHKSSFVVFSQDGETVHVACYWEFKGQPVVWHGKGTRKGGKVKYSYSTTRGPAKWEPYGVHDLTLSKDGKSMTGTWTNQKKQTGPLKFIRKK